MDTLGDDVSALKAFVSALAGELSTISPEMAAAVERAATAAACATLFNKGTVMQDIGIAVMCAQHDAAKSRAGPEAGQQEPAVD